MLKNNIILGNDQTSKYVAYGDDSKVGDYIVYAFIIIKRCDITYCEDKIKLVKNLYGIPENIPIHCSVLLSGHKRKKIGIGHISTDYILSLLKRIVRMFNQIPICLIYTYCNYKKYQNAFEKYNSSEKQMDSILSITPEYKGLLGLMANCSISLPHTIPQIPRVNECQIITSKDPTKIYFAGEHQRQAHRWIEMPIGFSADEKPNYLIQPLALESKNSVMLQIADVAAYMCAQAKSDGRHALFFKKTLNRVKHFTKHEFYHCGS